MAQKAETSGSWTLKRTSTCVVRLLSQHSEEHYNLAYSLHQLSEQGNTEVLKKKLMSTKDIDQLDGEQLAPLHYAARYSRLRAMGLLLASGARPDVRDRDHRTPLHYVARCRAKVHSLASYSSRGTRLVEVPGTAPAAAERRSVHERPAEGEEESAVRPAEGEEESAVQLLCRHGASVAPQDKYGYTPLHLAAMTANTAVASELVEACQASVEIGDNQEMTPLMVAATHGHVAIARLLLESGRAELLKTDSFGKTALHSASRGGHLGMVNLLLQKGRNSKGFMNFLDAKDAQDKTALYHACSNGHALVACVLLQEKADVEASTKTLATPLHASASVGSLDTITVLLKYKARVDAPDLFQRTPLMYAAAGNHSDALRLLVQHGASLEHRDLNESTALLVAAQSSHEAAVQTLLDLGGDVRAADKLDKTAVYYSAEKGKIGTLKALLVKAESREVVNATDCNGRPPLHVAVEPGNVAVVEALLKAGASVQSRNEEQDTVLHLAASRGSVRLVSQLVSKCSQLVNAENGDLNTALHLACKAGQEGVARALLGAGANHSATNAACVTPLHLAAAGGHAASCRLLLDSGAPADQHDKENKTPLMLGVVEGHVAVVRVLLEKGASLTVRDNSGLNPLQLATLAGQRDTAMVIVTSPQWEEALRHRATTHEEWRTTPFRMLVVRLPDVAEEVLNRCIKPKSSSNTSNDTSAKDDDTGELNFEYLEDIFQTQDNPSQVASESEPTATAKNNEDARLLNEKKGTESSVLKPYSTDARLLYTNHPLTLMIKHRRETLLAHPVCVHLIKHKWMSYGRFVYLVNLAFYLVFLVSLTACVLSARDPNWKFDNDTHPGKELLKNPDVCKEQANWREWQGPAFISVTKWCVVFVAFLEMVKELSHFYQARTAYLRGQNLVEWVCYSSAVLFVLDFNGCPVKQGWQWQMGAMAIFLAWMDLLLFIRVFPFFGIYVIMFTEVLKTFISFFVVFFMFIVAFGLGFHTVSLPPRLLTPLWFCPGLRGLTKN
ncbi:transient receptor potential cation channel subfamily A member 1 homolog [Procambarus clarkii]|uniref:transient receptor potential cation channel subfamily A member 1 homolog n=1 Tax=Procambarus clarkii TaxID=6728 RepID=UPI0037436E48